MKKVALFTWLILIIFGLYACATPSGAPSTAAVPEFPQATKEAEIIQPPDWIAGPVVLLVLDDFTIEQPGYLDFSLESFNNLRVQYRNFEKFQWEETKDDDACIYTIDGQAAYTSKGAAAYTSKGAEKDGGGAGVSHGFLVYDQLVSLIEEDVFDGEPLNQLIIDATGQNFLGLNWMPMIRIYRQDNQDLVLAAVDTSQYSTKAVAERLQAAVTAFKDKGYQRFVINMSFVIIPCRDNPETVQKTFEVFKQVVEEPDPVLQADPGLAIYQGTLAELTLSDTELKPEATARLAIDPLLNTVRLRSYYTLDVPLDAGTIRERFSEVIDVPLYYTLTDLQSDENLRIFPIAAAGNQSLSYPFAPAMWDNVLSVSAYEEAGRSKAEYSNSGEVIMNGQTYYQGNVETHGTSFAAPRVSYQATKYLLHGGPVMCSGIDTYPSFPVMGYAQQDGNWQNMTLNDASNRFCTHFLANFEHVINEPASPEEQPAYSCQDPLGCLQIGPSDEVHIAYALTLNDENESISREILNSIEIAFEERGWELLGHKIGLSGVETPCSSEGGDAAGQSLASDASIAGVIGPLCSSSALAVMPYISNAGMVMISSSNTNRHLTNPDEHLAGYLRTASSDLRQGQVAADFAYYQLGVSQAATVAVADSDYSEGLVQAFADRFIELGGTLTAQERIDGNSDIYNVMSWIAEGNPQLLYFPIFDPQNVEIAAKARDFPGMEGAYLLSSDIMEIPGSIQSAGPGAEGMFITGWNLPTESSAYRAFLESWKARYGSEPANKYHVQAYDAAGLLLTALEMAAYQEPDGSLSIPRQGLRDVLYNMQGYNGLGGTLNCNAYGDCAAPQSLAVFQVTMDNINGAWPLPVVWVP